MINPFRCSIDNPHKDFKCFQDDHNDKRPGGNCQHNDPPIDGVWKMAPRHYKMLEDMRAKYECLLSYDNCNRTEATWISTTHPALNRFPEECRALNTKRSADWQHGHDCAMVACLRLVNSLLLKNADCVRKIENWEEIIQKEKEEYSKLTDKEKEMKDKEDLNKVDEAMFTWFMIKEYPYLEVEY